MSRSIAETSRGPAMAEVSSIASKEPQDELAPPVDTVPSLARGGPEASESTSVPVLAEYSEPVIVTRPPIDYSSPRAFARSFSARLRSIFTKRFIFALLAGQIVSLCITCTNVTTTELVHRNFTTSTTQTLFLYFALFIIYTPYTIYQYGFKGWLKMIAFKGWKYIFLAACDVEGNFLVVRAYQYTTLLSCLILDSWAIPVCLFVSWVLMRPKYRWSQIIGVLICLGGDGLLIAADHITNKDYPASNMVKGDLFMLAGATLYGFSNAFEEFFVRQSPLYEVVGQLGMWGTIINGIQAAGLEHEQIKTENWDGPVIGLLLAYTAAMVILYTIAPILYRLASSAYYNLSIITSDFWGLLFGLFLYHYAPYWLYFIAFAFTIVGLVVYFWQSTPEEQGKVDPQRPGYVRQIAPLPARGHGVAVAPEISTVEADLERGLARENTVERV